MFIKRLRNLEINHPDEIQVQGQLNSRSSTSRVIRPGRIYTFKICNETNTEKALKSLHQSNNHYKAKHSYECLHSAVVVVHRQRGIMTKTCLALVRYN